MKTLLCNGHGETLKTVKHAEGDARMAQLSATPETTPIGSERKSFICQDLSGLSSVQNPVDSTQLPVSRLTQTRRSDMLAKRVWHLTRRKASQNVD